MRTWFAGKAAPPCRKCLWKPWDQGMAARSHPPRGLGDCNQESAEMDGRGRNPVFSLKEVFSLLYLLHKPCRLCVCVNCQCRDTSHIPCCSASQGNPRKDSGCSSTTGSSRALARVVSTHPSPKVPFGILILCCFSSWMSPRPVGLTGQCHSSVNSSH